MGKILLVAVSLLLLASQAWATHKSFVWDAPTTNEDGTPLADLADYRVYSCPSEPCSLANGVLLGAVIAPTTSLAVPHGQRGFAFVTARDTSGNESVESNLSPFDTLRPATPGRFRIE